MYQHSNQLKFTADIDRGIEPVEFLSIDLDAEVSQSWIQFNE